jgi:phage terminase small subunit
MATSRLGAKLNLQQRLFVAEYLVDLNGTQAAIRAGYSAKTANEQAARLLAKASIKEAVEAKRVLLVKRTDVTAERIIGELAKLGFANMEAYMRPGDNGDPILDFSKLTSDQMAALTEVTVDDYVDGRGENARAVKRVKFKLADKRAALVDLGKHLGLFVDRHEVTGKDGADLLPPAIAISFGAGGPGQGGGPPVPDDEGTPDAAGSGAT